jgi:hypothetical protein
MVQNSVDAAIRGSTGTTRRRSFSHLLGLVTNLHKRMNLGGISPPLSATREPLPACIKPIRMSS